MTELHHELEEERRIINAATAGPWKRDIYAGVVQPKSRLMTGYTGYNTCLAEYMTTENAKFAVHARTALPLRNAQVAAVYGVLNKLRRNPRNDYEVGYDKALDTIRRAIEEAGA